MPTTSDTSAANRMRHFTANHTGRRLAIVLDGKVISAPRILTTINDRARITGRFEKSELEYLRQALDGLVNTSPSEASHGPVTKEKSAGE